jgi:hypothetical protein
MSSSRSAVVKAASLFEAQERKRLKRPLLTLNEKVELIVDLRALNSPETSRMARAHRGEAAVNLVGSGDTFEDSAVDALEQILRAVQMRGLSPVAVLHEAWTSFEQAPPKQAEAQAVTADETPVVGAVHPPVKSVAITDSMGFPLYIPEPSAPPLTADGDMNDGGML